MNDKIIYNSEKFKAMIHYIISRCESKDNFARVVLYKLLYFSDFDNYEKYEESISGETYIRKKRGPVPSHFLEAISELIDEGKINMTTKNISLGRVMYNYSSLKKPSIKLSEDELFVINEVINELSYMNANQISEYSHGDMPWKATDDMDIIDYGFVFYRNPEYVKRQYDESD